jgi:tetratricopeptide (TPR) repeat protein
MASQLTPEGNTRALGLFQQALALEPDNARALEGLSRVYANLSNMSSTDEREVVERQRQAHEAAARAVAADPEYSLGHLRMGLLAIGDNDLGAAARHVTRALELAPADPDTLSGASTLLRELGRVEEAIAIGEYIAARDPVSVDGHRWLCMSQVLAGRWDAAIASCNTALALSPGTSQVQYQIGLALLGKGDAVAALAAFEKEAGDEEYRTKGRAVALYTLGRQAEFEQAFSELRERWGGMWPSEIAQVYAWVGDADQAFAWLDKALAQNEAGLTQQFLLLLYQPVRDDPRWMAFRERVGMSEAQLAAISFEVKLPN